MASAPGSSSALKPGVRIDKWLWAARFFKTRSLATDAIDAGHVRRAGFGSVAGERVKPSLAVKVGDSYVIQRGDSAQEIAVLSLSDRRGSAADAALLYKETELSIAARLAKLSNRGAVVGASTNPVLRGRPTKHDRRKLAQLFASTYASGFDAASPE